LAKLHNILGNDNCGGNQNCNLISVYESRQSKSLTAPHVYHDDGNTSDTPTDILVSTQPLDKMNTGSSWRQRQRRGSAGSDASNESFSDIDEQLCQAARKRSKSADNRGKTLI